MYEKRVPVKDLVVPRCTEACPAGVDVPRYIRAVKDQKFDEAMAVLREKLPLPTVCADACFAPCEEVCAYIKAVQGDSVTYENIIRHMEKLGVSKIHYPKRIEFVEEIPLTAAGKADKKVLRKDIQEKIRAES